MIFTDRAEAGRMLAKLLSGYAGHKNLIVLGIPRGGVPVAFEVAGALGAALDVFVARKLGVPMQEELAFGAIASGGVRVLDAEIVEAAGISQDDIEQVAARERKELERRERLYRGSRSALHVTGRTVILVDDGIATGSSMRAAILALRQRKPAQIVVAVPVAPASTCNRLRRVDDVICVHTPAQFRGIGEFYEDFSQVTDEEVAALLHRSTRRSTQHVA